MARTSHNFILDSVSVKKAAAGRREERAVWLLHRNIQIIDSFVVVVVVFPLKGLLEMWTNSCSDSLRPMCVKRRVSLRVNNCVMVSAG